MFDVQFKNTPVLRKCNLRMEKNTAEITEGQMNPANTIVRKAHQQDAEMLVELGKRAFNEAFAELTAPDDMAAYLQATFSIDEITAQLNKKDSQYLIVELQADPVGYAYLYPTRPLGCIKGPKAIQLIRFYLLKKCYGRGVGNTLMQTCLDEAHARSYRSIWLSSWDLNGRANAFYKRWHFKVVGRQKFVVGSNVQNDFIFSRQL